MTDPKKILISGASGFIGKALSTVLTAKGCSVSSLVRRPAANGLEIQWSPDDGPIEAPKLEGFDTVIHMAGENIFGRWSGEKKRKIYNSRINGTKLLAESLLHCKQKPKTFLSASAIGYYGSCGDKVLTEQSPKGEGFLPNVCADWEAAAAALRSAGIRTAFLRTGIVLSSDGGTLQKMLPPFKLGLGGKIGDGSQYISWIELEDYLQAVLHIMNTSSLSGPINLVAPNPVTNLEFTQTLASLLHRPAILPVPKFVLRTLLGDFADEALLASARVQPKVLEDSGFKWQAPNLQDALKHYL